MTFPASIFPNQVWDGLHNTERKSQSDDLIPTSQCYSALASEIISIETVVKDLIITFQGPQGPQGAQGPPSIIGPPGPQGAQGARGELGSTIQLFAPVRVQATQQPIQPRIYTLNAGEIINAGAPLYILESKVFQAQAVAEKYQVAGLALKLTGINMPCMFLSEGPLELMDWSNITGTITLIAGSIYFLDVLPGRIINIGPTSGYVVRIGRAISTTMLDVEIFPSVKL